MKINDKALSIFCLIILLLTLSFIGFSFGNLSLLGFSLTANKKHNKISKDFKEITDLLLENRSQAVFELKDFLSKKQYQNQREKNYALYILGRLKQKDNQAQVAYEYYQKIDPKKIGALETRVYLHRAETQVVLGNERIVLINCKKIINNHPGSVSSPAAYYELGRSFVRQSEFEKAQRVFRDLIKKFPKTNHGIAANYYLGVISNKTNQKSKQERDQFWINYLKESPQGYFSEEIVKAWLEEDRKKTRKLDSRKRELIGLNLYQQNKNKESLRFLEENWSENSWFERARLLFIVQRKAEGKNFLISTLQRLPDDKNFRKAVSFLFKNISYVEIKDILPGLIASNQKQRDFLLWEASRFEKSKRNKLWYYREIIKDLKNSEISLQDKQPRIISKNKFKVLSLRALFWQAYQKRNFFQAKDYAQKIIALDPQGESSAKVRFWLAKHAEEKKKTTNAKVLYQKLLEKNPRSYYAYRAKKRLAELNKEKLDQGWEVKDFTFWKAGLLRIFEEKQDKKMDCPLPESSLLETIHSTVQELLALNLWQEARSLISTKQRKENKPIDIWITCKLENNRASSIYKAYNQISRKNLNFQTEKSTWLSAYPFAYLLTSAKASSKLNLDPLLLLSIVRQESRFQKNAISRSGAIGLSQLMPNTAKEISLSAELQLPYSKENLLKPEYNLRLGAFYLKQMLNTFERPELAVAAYNAGPGNVSKWLKNSSSQIKDDPDLFIESIRFEETKNYVIQVLENYWIYSNLFLLETK